MKEEVPCHNIFSACRRKLVLDGHMLMTCKYAAKEGLMLEVLDEIACDGIFLLKLIVPVWLGNCAIGQLSLVPGHLSQYPFPGRSGRYASYKTHNPHMCDLHGIFVL